ncbi:hypothetical protein GCM10023320_39880 [Pseudonocardia adelaidensis]|uniref:Mutator family transposase n=1 Tax=Pseudonocardia adelaidensis TaxID=648754 RepID=A0ABP9NN46_9PSEU
MTGALGFWGALREVFPQTREQRCWFHKMANVLGALPKSAHPGARKALAEIWNAEDRRHALDAVTRSGSRAAFKLIEAAQDRWRAVNAPHLVAIVRAGATFEAGELVERPDEHPQPEAA